MIKFTIERKKLALLVHDMQNAFIRHSGRFSSEEARSILPNTERLIKACRNKGIQIIYTQVEMRDDLLDWGLLKDVLPQDALRESFQEGGEEAQIYSTIAPQKGDIVIRKNSYSSFFNTNLEGLLRSLQLDTLAITGVTTNVGCDSTARDALYRRIKVIFLTDATGAHALHDVGWGEISGEDVHKVTCSIIGNYIGQLSTTSQFINELI